jgi:hypothetical protein
MPIRRQAVKVLRFWYRISTSAEARALSHPAFRWLYGITMAWTGYNNGAIEFTRRRHGPLYGLRNPGVFDRASKEVIGSGLVMVAAVGGNSVPAKYTIVNAPVQVSSHALDNGTSEIPSRVQINGTSKVPSRAKSGTSEIPSRYLRGTVKTTNIRRSRARLNRKRLSQPQRAPLTAQQSVTATNSDSCHANEHEAKVAGADVTVQIPPSASRH